MQSPEGAVEKPGPEHNQLQFSEKNILNSFLSRCIFMSILFIQSNKFPALFTGRPIDMFMIEYKDIGWWYWLVTAPLLTIGVLGNEIGFILAIGLTVFQLIHYIIREKDIKSFPVQVRFFYLLLLIVSFPDIMQWLYWVPCIGTWAQVIFGYCAMARLVSLLPWNREEPFSVKLITNTFLSRPVRGSVQQGFAASK